MKIPATIAPFYFGSAGKRLFGCYHEPRIGPAKNCAVVICQPMGHEYIYCHRAIRQLASRLSEIGFPVLRFDFYGCGDSAGDEEEGTVSQWLNDIFSAVKELRTRTLAAQICLIGVRLGATLSFVNSIEHEDIDSLVMWDPIIDGTKYLEELYSLERQAIRFRRKSVSRSSGVFNEIVGFPLPSSLRSDLEKLNLFDIVPQPHAKILSLYSESSDKHACFRQHLTTHHVEFECQQLGIPKIWIPTVDGNLLVPAQMLKSVVSWINKTHA